jgi:hypothetical protein
VATQDKYTPYTHLKSKPQAVAGERLTYQLNSVTTDELKIKTYMCTGPVLLLQVSCLMIIQPVPVYVQQ